MVSIFKDILEDVNNLNSSIKELESKIEEINNFILRDFYGFCNAIRLAVVLDPKLVHYCKEIEFKVPKSIFLVKIEFKNKFGKDFKENSTSNFLEITLSSDSIRLEKYSAKLRISRAGIEIGDDLSILVVEKIISAVLDWTKRRLEYGNNKLQKSLDNISRACE